MNTKVKYKKAIEVIVGYIIALAVPYLLDSFIFGFHNYVKMFIFVSALYWFIVYVKMSSEKRTNKK